MYVNDIDQQLLSPTKSLALFPAPHQPQRGSSSVLCAGKEGLVTFVTLSCLDGMRYDISRFSTVHLIWPCLKSCCLPVPSIATAISK